MQPGYLAAKHPLVLISDSGIRSKLILIVIFYVLKYDSFLNLSCNIRNLSFTGKMSNQLFHLFFVIPLFWFYMFNYN